MAECTTLFEVVFVCNILILIFSGVVNILLCERLRRRKCELCAAHQRSFHSLAVPPQPNSPASDTSSHLDQERKLIFSAPQHKFLAVPPQSTEILYIEDHHH
ncbi:hypothetical protein F2P79_007146 [Pimephales promelas]|nr:hypothetical protein F2P79_007146 [Pimephales promelas]